MKKHIILFTLIALSITLFSSCLLLYFKTRRPPGLTINNNKEMAKLIPVLIKDVPLIIEKLETLRLGLAIEKEYSIELTTLGGGYLYCDGDWIYRDEYKYDPQILMSYRYEYGYHSYNFSERLEEFSAEEIDAIHYLLSSNALQMNASSIHFGSGDWQSPYAVFAHDDRYILGIYYFNTAENEKLIHFRHRDYVEELEGNYWLVMWFREY